MASKEADDQFWTIIGANNFSGYDQRPEATGWEVVHASLDYRISRQREGSLTEDIHLAEQLERDFGLTIEQAFQAIELGRQRASNYEE